ncbi:hypothetical protein FRB96_006627 [Tulasnella sp. 330]|nr:hypothetical protein FRB96_006627 [Tulasnella sp. 330]KAG8881326.1 hypothetical protein FRB97_009668 [Tulasnella sp. 331]
MSNKGSRNGSGEAAGVAIMPGLLYLGPLSAAASTTFLSASSISDVLSIGSTPTKRFLNITYHRIALIDSPNADFDNALNQATTIIDVVVNSGGAILAHCSAAISRSLSVVAGYLMKKNRMTLREALGLIIQA